MSKVRIVFLGTPEFAVVSLKKLIADEHFEIVGVVTQPDRPAGRKLQLTPSPVKSLALAHGLKVISPDKINQEVILQEIQSWGAEVAVVVAYGQILSQKFLDLFPFGAVNVHGSILPRWRGAAPIQRAIEAGDTESGVTLQKIVKELDAGDILGIRKVEVDDKIHAMQLHDKLAELGADLLVVELMDYIRGNLAPHPQGPDGITFAKKIDKQECEIKWNQKAVDIHNKVRAFVMGPGTYTSFQGKKLKIHSTKVSSDQGSTPGKVFKVKEDSFLVATQEKSLEIFEVQPESKNRMKASDFIKGYKLTEGDRFG